jgi:hypothetical protein
MGILRAVCILALGCFSTTVWAEQVFTGNLTAAQEVPPNASSATGFGRVTLNDAETQITVSVYYSGLTSPGTTVGHIHGAAAGVNGGVIFNLAPLAGQTSGSVVNATFTVTPTQVSNLKLGLMYFNIHTTTNPGGEIRGQITADAGYVATLTGKQENPPAVSAGTGRASISLNSAGTQALVSVQWADVSGPLTVGHVHSALFGSNGPVVCNLSPPTVAAGAVVDFLCTFSPAQIAALKRGVFYVNLHTSANPGGEIRGQIVPRNGLIARLSAAQEVPTNASVGSGLGFVEINETTGVGTVNISWNNLSGAATSGHIHVAEIGTNGSVICNLSPAAAISGSVDDFACTLTATQIESLKNGLGYFNIHTSANPGGEIRGQINASLRDGFEDQNAFVPFSISQLWQVESTQSPAPLIGKLADPAAPCHGGQ